MDPRAIDRRVMTRRTRLRRRLDDIYRRYHSPSYLRMDPLLCVRRFSRPRQIETVGLLASCLAYGRVEQIIRSIETVLALCGADLPAVCTRMPFAEKTRLFSRFRHRFSTGFDVALLLEATSRIYDTYGSLMGLFHACLLRGDGTMRSAMHAFSSEFRHCAETIHPSRSGSFEFFFPSPLRGSACKRLNMYFRWMIRSDDGIDLGIWDRIPASLLIVPLDVHVARIAASMGLSRRTTVDWKAADEVTARLRAVEPEDPVKYDFSLCRYGMVRSIHERRAN